MSEIIRARLAVRLTAETYENFTGLPKGGHYFVVGPDDARIEVVPPKA